MFEDSLLRADRIERSAEELTVPEELRLVHDSVRTEQLIQADATSWLGLIQALGRHERS